MNRRRTGALAAVAVLVMLAGCGDDPASRADVLADYASDVAVPRFEGFARAADDVVRNIDSACESPGDATVEAAVSAVDGLRETWLSTEALWTGPVMERRSPAVTDWPVKTADIERLVEEAEPGGITADVIGNNVGADTRGLTAMRWVLSRDDVLDVLTDERWCDYLTSNASVVAAEADLIVADWTESFDDGRAFSEVIADGEEADDWLEMLVNDNIFLVHKLTEEQRDEGDVPPVDPAADRAARTAGVAAVAEALAPLLGDDLAERLNDEVATAQEAFRTGDIEQGRERAEEVEATLATEVAARLDVTIGFSDADGDSAG